MLLREVQGVLLQGVREVREVLQEVQRLLAWGRGQVPWEPQREVQVQRVQVQEQEQEQPQP